MKSSMQPVTYSYTTEHRKKRRRLGVLNVLAAIVVFCTTYALILPAITWEKTLICKQEEHTHTDACYKEVRTPGQLTCTREEHVHTDACFEVTKTLTCTLPETEGHTHEPACYDDEGNAICGLEECEPHTHTDECYTETKDQICDKPEHTHTEACYGEEKVERVLTCTKQEHTHTDACFDAPPAEEKEYACGKVEHTHTADCYFADGTLRCTLPEHTHTAACESNDTDNQEKTEDWEETLKDVELTGNWNEDVLAIAESQLGYEESTTNFRYEGSSKKGYTRYGAWYGVPYGDWCAMFCSFCLNYAEVDRSLMPIDANCPRWIRTLSGKDYDRYYKNDTYIPQPGDLIFFDWDSYDEESARGSDHVGIVAELIYEDVALPEKEAEEAEEPEEPEEVPTISEPEKPVVPMEVLLLGSLIDESPLTAGFFEKPEVEMPEWIEHESTDELLDEAPDTEEAEEVEETEETEETEESTEEDEEPAEERPVIDLHIKNEEGKVLTKIRTIEGNSANRVQYVTYDIEDDRIMGYGKLPQNPEMKKTIESKPAKDGAVAVIEGCLPEGAEAVITAVELSEKELVDYFGAEKAAAMKSFTAYDIKILVDGKEWEPDDTVSVVVKHTELSAEEDEGFAVAHVDEATQEVTELDGDLAEDGEVSFETDGFSLYIFYTFTVDFRFGEYQFSLDGMESITLSKLFTRLGINMDVANVAEVRFSDESLLSVTAQDGDWLLTSHKAFTSSETLTVVFSDGTELVIEVTDDSEELIQSTLKVTKVWNDTETDHPAVVVYLFKVGEEGYTASAILSKNNNYTCTFDVAYSSSSYLPYYVEEKNEPEGYYSEIGNYRHVPASDGNYWVEVNSVTAGGPYVIYNDSNNLAIRHNSGTTHTLTSKAPAKALQTKRITVGSTTYDSYFDADAFDSYDAWTLTATGSNYYLNNDNRYFRGRYSNSNYLLSLDSNTNKTAFTVNSNGISCSLNSRTRYVSVTSDGVSLDSSATKFKYYKSVQGDPIPEHWEVTITNTPIVETELDVTKQWKDTEETHPSVTVNLYRNGSSKVVDSLTLNEANGFAGTFAGLQLDIDGSLPYYVKEANEPEGYYSKIGSYQPVPAVTTTKKYWVEVDQIEAGGTYIIYDEGNSRALRRNSSTLTLKTPSSAQQKKSKTIDGISYNSYFAEGAFDGNDQWTFATSGTGYTIKNGSYYFRGRYSSSNYTLSLYNSTTNTANDKTTFTVDSTGIYTTVNSQTRYVTISGGSPSLGDTATKYKFYKLVEDPPRPAHYAVTITNTPMQHTKLHVKKQWSDGRTDHDPVTIYLYKEGQATPDFEQEISAATNWTCDFENVPLSANGTLDYVVKESPVEGMVADVSEFVHILGGTPQYWIPVTGNTFSAGGEYILYSEGNGTALSRNGATQTYKALRKKTTPIEIGGTTITNYFTPDQITANERWTWDASSRLSSGGYYLRYGTNSNDQYVLSLNTRATNGSTVTTVASDTNQVIRIVGSSRTRYLTLTTNSVGTNSNLSSGTPITLYQLVDGDTTEERYEVTITNRPAQTYDLDVKKEWSDGLETHEPLVVSLRQEGVSEPLATRELNEGNNWQATFEDLPETSDGFNYYVTEPEMPGYQQVVSQPTYVPAARPEYWVDVTGSGFENGESYVLYSNNYSIRNNGGVVAAAPTKLNGSIPVGGVTYPAYIDTKDVSEDMVWTATASSGSFRLRNDDAHFINDSKVISTSGTEAALQLTGTGATRRLIYSSTYSVVINATTASVTRAYNNAASSTFRIFKKVIGSEEERAAHYSTKLTNAVAQEATSSAERPIVHKRIDYLGDLAANPDTSLKGGEQYRLYMDTTNYSEDQNGIDLVLVLDATSSLEESGIRDDLYPVAYLDQVINGTVTDTSLITATFGANAETARTAPRETDGLIYRFLNANPNNRVGVVGFCDTSELRTSAYMVSKADLPNEGASVEDYFVFSGQLGRGTDYSAGMIGGKTKILDPLKNEGNTNRKTVFVFMTDGRANHYTNAQGQSVEHKDTLDERIYCAEVAADYYKQNIKGAFGNPYNISETYVIGFTEEAATGDFADVLYDFTENITGSRDDYYPCVTSDEVRDVLAKAAGLDENIGLISMVDTLSDEVSFSKPLDLKVTMEPVGSNESILLWQDNKATEANMTNIGPIITGVSVSGRKIQVDFNPDNNPVPYQAKFTVSYNISTMPAIVQKLKAKDYNATGDPDTDYGSNSTSSGKPGFHSNSEADVYYTYKDSFKYKTYPHPVVQVMKQPAEGEPKPSITMQIDYLGDGGNNPHTELSDMDAYRLYMTATNYDENQPPIDLIFVVDGTWSMTDQNQFPNGDWPCTVLDEVVNGTITDPDKETYVPPNAQAQIGGVLDPTQGYERADDGLAYRFLNANPDNRIGIVAFSKLADGQTVLRTGDPENPFISKEDLPLNEDGTVNYFQFVGTSGHGTNYEAGMYAADTMLLNSLTRDDVGYRKQVFVFLTDGTPDHYLSDDHTDTQSSDATACANQAVDYYQANILSSIDDCYVIGFTNTAASGDAEVLLLGMANDMSGTYENYYPCTSKDQLQEVLYEAAGLNDIYNPVKMVDKLSKYVELTDPLDLIVTMDKQDGSEPVVLWENGGPTEANKDEEGNPIVVSVTAEDDEVTVEFNPDAEISYRAKFEASYNVRTTEEAKEEFESQHGYGGVIGDEDTDYGDNETSSIAPGFYHSDAAFLEYVFGTERRFLDYQKPVVQTEFSIPPKLTYPYGEDVNVHKRIDYLGDNPDNLDENGKTKADYKNLYRLNVVLEARQKPIDMLIILDQSDAMAAPLSGSSDVTRNDAMFAYLNGTKADHSDGFISRFLSSNEDNALTVLTFGGDSSDDDLHILRDWDDTSLTVEESTPSGPANYAAALARADEIWNEREAGNRARLMIFLGSGVPTLAYSDGKMHNTYTPSGSGTTTESNPQVIGGGVDPLNLPEGWQEPLSVLVDDLVTFYNSTLPSEKTFMQYIEEKYANDSRYLIEDDNDGVYNSYRYHYYAMNDYPFLFDVQTVNITIPGLDSLDDMTPNLMEPNITSVEQFNIFRAEWEDKSQSEKDKYVNDHLRYIGKSFDMLVQTGYAYHDFALKHHDVITYGVGFGTDAYDHRLGKDEEDEYRSAMETMEYMSGPGRFAEATTPVELQQILDSVLEMRDVCLTDELSEYATMTSTPNLRIDITIGTDETERTATLYENGAFTTHTDEDGLEQDEVLGRYLVGTELLDMVETGISEGTLTVKFAEDLVFTEPIEVTASFDVSPTQTALDTWRTVGYGSPGNKGDKDTDADANNKKTSSGIRGFYSNDADDSKATWSHFGPEDELQTFEKAFPKPVLQVYEAPLPPPQLTYPELDDGVTISKQIDWQGDYPGYVPGESSPTLGKENLYTLHLNVTSNPKPVDLLLVIDTSGSMNYDMNGDTAGSSRKDILLSYLNGTEENDGFISRFLAANSANRLAVISFDRDSSNDDKRVLLDWTHEAQEINLNPAGATNYAAAYAKADEMWTAERELEDAEEHQKLMLFLSDGVPTLAYSDGKMHNTFAPPDGVEVVGNGADPQSATLLIISRVNLIRNSFKSLKENYDSSPLTYGNDLGKYIREKWFPRNSSNIFLIGSQATVADDNGVNYSRGRYYYASPEEYPEFYLVSDWVVPPGTEVVDGDLTLKDVDEFMAFMEELIEMNDGERLEWCLEFALQSYDMFRLTESAYAEFAGKNSDVATFAISFGNNSYNFKIREASEVLEYMAGPGRYAEAETPEELREFMDSFISLNNLAITDPLSEYATLASAPNLNVTLHTGDKDIQLVNNGVVTNVPDSDEDGDYYLQHTEDRPVYEEVDGELTDNIIDYETFEVPLLTTDADGKQTLNLRFSESFMSDMSVDVSFDIVPSAAAFTESSSEGGGYNAIGDAGTDYSDNNTSVGKAGFFSNNRSTAEGTQPVAAQTTWSRFGSQSRNFARPVLQCYVQNERTIKLVKADSRDTSQKLSGAHFALYACDSDGKPQEEPYGLYGDLVSDEDGVLTATDNTDPSNPQSVSEIPLPPGSYSLVETKAPNGYNRLTSPIRITVDASGVSAYLGESVSTNLAPTVSDGVYTFTVLNSNGYELPESGGMGTKLLTLCGIGLMTIAALMYGFSMRRKRERRYER